MSIMKRTRIISWSTNVKVTGEFTMLKGISVEESLVTQAKTDYFDSLDQIKVNNT